MAGRAAGLVGILGVAVGGYYFATKPAAAPAPSTMTEEQKKTALLRSRLSGHHPKVSGAKDCQSKTAQTGVSLKHLDSGKSTKGSDEVAGSKDARQVAGGTVVVK